MTFCSVLPRTRTADDDVDHVGQVNAVPRIAKCAYVCCEYVHTHSSPRRRRLLLPRCWYHIINIITRLDKYTHAHNSPLKNNNRTMSTIMLAAQTSSEICEILHDQFTNSIPPSPLSTHTKETVPPPSIRTGRCLRSIALHKIACLARCGVSFMRVHVITLVCES